MVLSIRILFCITLLVAVAQCHFFKSRGHSGWSPQAGVGCLGCFGIFARGVSSKCSHTCDIFNAVSKCDGTGDNDKSIENILNVAKGSSGIIDVSMDGLGSIFSNMVMCSYKIVFCCLHHSHKQYKCSLCSDNSYGHQWGWLQYSGHYNDIGSVIKTYQLENCQSDVEDLLRKYTNGRGLQVLTGTKRLIAEAIWRVSEFFSRDYKSWCLDDAHSIFLKVATIAGALANSHRAGLGDDVVDGLMTYCKDFFEEMGYTDMSTSTANIKKDLEQCDREDFNGAITYDNNNGNGNNNNDNNNNRNNDNNNNRSDQNNDNNSASNSKSDSNANANASSRQSSNNENNVTSNNKNDNKNSQTTNVVINNYVCEDGTCNPEKQSHNTASSQQDEQS